MARTEKPSGDMGKRKRRRATAPIPYLLSLGPLVILLTGCISDDRAVADATRRDPLRGEHPALPAGRNSPGAGNASGTSLDPNRSLQIGLGPPQPVPASETGGGEWKGPSSRSEGAAFKPDRPEPPPPTARSAGPFATTSFGSVSSRVATFEQAQAQLTSRRVTGQRLEMWGDEGEWKFSCRIPRPENPNIARTYEARAPDPIAAMRAVIEQIDRER
jgi:hypothetical protein